MTAFFLFFLSGGSMLPPPYGAFPYVQSPQILPAVAPLTPRLPAAYYSPVFYWPYPSPPVSPTTYYPHSSTTVVSIIFIIKMFQTEYIQSAEKLFEHLG